MVVDGSGMVRRLKNVRDKVRGRAIILSVPSKVTTDGHLVETIAPNQSVNIQECPMEAKSIETHTHSARRTIEAELAARMFPPSVLAAAETDLQDRPMATALPVRSEKNVAEIAVMTILVREENSRRTIL